MFICEKCLEEKYDNHAISFSLGKCESCDQEKNCCDIQSKYLNLKENKYVIKTDKGYITGDMHKGVEFVSKSEARVFDEYGIEAYWDSIVDDMFRFHNVESIETELL